MAAFAARVAAQHHRKKIRLFVIDATQVAQASGMGRRTNTVLQTCFFALSGVLPKEEAIMQIKKAIAKTYGRKGEQIVRMNYAAVDAALAGLHEVEIPRRRIGGSASRPCRRPSAMPRSSCRK